MSRFKEGTRVSFIGIGNGTVIKCYNNQYLNMKVLFDSPSFNNGYPYWVNEQWLDEIKDDNYKPKIIISDLDPYGEEDWSE